MFPKYYRSILVFRKFPPYNQGVEIYYKPSELVKKRSRIRLQIFLWCLAVSGLLAGLVYIGVYSPVFRVRNIRVEGISQLTAEVVLNVVKPLVFHNAFLQWLGERNMLAWREQQISVPTSGILLASIGRNIFTRSVTISIKERKQAGIWCFREACFWFDQEGVLFESAPQTEGSLLAYIEEDRLEPIPLGEKIIDDRFLNNTLKLITGLPEINFAIEKITFNRELQELTVFTYNGPRVLLSIRFDPTQNINGMQNLRPTLNFSELEYIDLRVENRIFYKP